MKRIASATALVFAAVFSLSTARAAEIKVISSVGVKTALEDLKPQFEKASGHKLAIKFGTAVPLHREIVGGAGFDLAILTPALIDDLVKSGKVKAGTAATVAKAGIGVAIRPGSPKPDISNADAFKRTLLAAKAIA